MEAKISIQAPENRIDWTRDCAAVIACFDEAASIADVVASVREFLPTVFVVDDGSTDSTARDAARAGAVVIRRPINRGKGAALRLAWREARAAGFSWALSLDGDGQHAASDIPKFFAHAEQTGAALIVGNRMDRSAAMPAVRLWANRWMSRCLSNLTGAHLPDSQCGFRLAHLETLLRLPLAATGFVIESETLVAFLADGRRIGFVPIEVIYGAERSKICPWRDTWRWMRWTGQQFIAPKCYG